MLEETANDQAATGNATKGLSRRQMVKAGVWAAPVVAIAVATPAAAASSIVPTAVKATKSATGNSYTIAVTFTSSYTVSTTVSVSVALQNKTTTSTSVAVAAGGGTYSVGSLGNLTPVTGTTANVTVNGVTTAVALTFA